MKTMLFIDGAYLEKGTFKPEKYRVDFVKMIEFLEKDCKEEILRSYYYYAMPYISSQPTEQEKGMQSRKEKFVNYLRKIQKLELRKGRTQKIDSIYIQKQVDVYFSIDLVKLSLKKSIERAVLIAGDSDFCPAIQSAKDEGILIKLYYFKGSVHNELFTLCDERTEINEHLKHFATKT